MASRIASRLLCRTGPVVPGSCPNPAKMVVDHDLLQLSLELHIVYGSIKLSILKLLEYGAFTLESTVGNEVGMK